MKARMVNRIWGVAGLVLAGAVHCGSSPDATPRPVTDEQALSTALDRIDSPGTQVAQAPSSLAPVQHWTAYLSDSVTVLGTDASGHLKAAVVMEVDAQRRPRALVWGIARDLGTAPSDVMNAVAKDFRGTGTSTSGTSAAQTVHPLGTPAGSAGSGVSPACENGLGKLVQEANAVVPPGTTKDVSPIPGQVEMGTAGSKTAKCYAHDPTMPNVPGYCDLTYGTVTGPLSGTGTLGVSSVLQADLVGLAAKCCEKPTPPLASNDGQDSHVAALEGHQVTILGEPVSLICQAEP
jgi:hypothetical protein